ncbi:MAG: ADP-ribosylglycohydrolase family protein, partial [Desulfovibrio sp.]|nr:ADP-ribosylglycohydrolase family protein [Desulfovibrio sp.]
MIGAIIGDMAGSRFEHHPHRAGIDPLGFPLFTGQSRFTDDTVMSIAVSQALMDAAGDPDRLREACALRFKEYGRRYPAAG